MDEVVELVVRNLQNYHYPAFRIVQAESGQLDFGGGVRGDFCEDHANTDGELDNYHYRLLRSENAYLNLMGMASVIYWGWANGEIREVRVRWFLNGHGNMPPTTAAIAQERLLRAKEALENGNCGLALSSFQGVSQLGRTPFSSKIIAFLAPNSAGVYDTKIQNAILELPALANWPRLDAARNGCGEVDSGAIQDCYIAWCSALQSIAGEISNRGLGQPRPLDIERAIFAAYIAHGNP
ncbi:MAG: hypothetical protein JSR81_04125 [Proteobacteria bacterium]|nr:hypothetical protein [Pseudomonadota bacterium]